ncbi:MAG: TylF/MycF family methyltransferase, partial [Armatimonadota bacterium]|nr:TylF/MycF family methyltransferase [Armatimonadota bacterium]
MEEKVDARGLYLDLMKRCLTNMIYQDPDQKTLFTQTAWKRKISSLLAARHIKLVQIKPFDAQARSEGQDWPQQAHTMIGLKRLENLQFCIENALAHDIPGDLIETGVWRGGAAIFMRAILKAYQSTARTVWVADSFHGLPPPNPSKYPHDQGDIHYAFTDVAISLD